MSATKFHEDTKWALKHPELGFITFKSYRTVSVSHYPNPRGLYTRKEDAFKRTEEDFYYNNKLYSGTKLRMLNVTITTTWDDE